MSDPAAAGERALSEQIKTPENHQIVKDATSHQFYFQNTLLQGTGLCSPSDTRDCIATSQYTPRLATLDHWLDGRMGDLAKSVAR